MRDTSLTGLHDVQEVNITKMSWTTDEAIVPATLVPSSKNFTVLELNVLHTHHYWKERAQMAAKAA